ncbi:MAG: hypothetical protein ACXAC5_13465 [Promethearchaeota archaeon]
MKKKNIAFILFAVAGVNLLTLLFLPLIFTSLFELYETIGISSTLPTLLPIMIALTSIIPIVVLVVVGIIIYIKFRNE